MNTEEKAMAYDEMVQRVKELHEAGNALTKKQMEIIFPELAESEDEKIRKALINIVKGACSKYGIKYRIDEISEEKLLAYLEKQKEQNSYEPKNWPADKDNLTQEQKEQKPIEKQDYSGLNDLERVIHRGFLCAGVENVPVVLIKETAQECLAQMQPTCWSEEEKDKVVQYLHDRDGGMLWSKATEIAIDILYMLRPSWRPSEEQMGALKAIME